MIILNRLFNYLKITGIFIIFELFISFIVSILNLIGVNSGISSIIMLIFNICLVFYLGYYNSSLYLKKGYLEGLFLGILIIILMILIKIILFDNTFTVASIIYYSILLVISIVGGMFGINKKESN